MNKADEYYISTLWKLLLPDYYSIDENPRARYKDGTPAHTRFLTQVVEQYDISKGEFPIPTIRNTAIKTGIQEIFWIYQKSSNSLEDAHELGITWWDEFDIGNGTIGSRYGDTVVRYKLMSKLLWSLEANPFGRRHIMDLYQYEDLNSSDGLYPCAFNTMWTVRKDGEIYYIDLTLSQRSSDYITAGFINKIQYVALGLMVVGHLRYSTDLNYQLGKFCHLTQNVHIYDRHIEAAEELIKRIPLLESPEIKLKTDKNFYDYTIEDFEINLPKGIEKLKSSLELAI